jgi:hypothetical protein
MSPPQAVDRAGRRHEHAFVALSRAVLRRRDELIACACRAADPHGLFAEASTRFREMVRFDAALWMATDPATGLPAAPLRVENIEGDHCATYWARESLVYDVNLYTGWQVAGLGRGSVQGWSPERLDADSDRDSGFAR